ncbi:WXG100 family type VII secretion target [Pseudonocardia sp.]|uniref:WXG100 family type VII secretion target n=1 Tax=Pseudonocardia sp. TaxID=60912 RepID=UPI003D0A16D2
MSTIKVTFAELANAQTSLAGAAGRMNSQLDDLRGYLQPLVATWQGQAAERYAEAQRRWDAAAADLTAVLARIGGAVGAANDSYQEVERANAARWA